MSKERRRFEIPDGATVEEAYAFGREDERSSARFRPGLYRHFKGGLYTAICLVTHHETREPMVLYVSHTYGGMNVRPLNGWRTAACVDVDGWNDLVLVRDSPGRHPVLRFQFISDLPSDTPIGVLSP